jgi:16S rRNA (guanine966-N2)-methyltransferase
VFLDPPFLPLAAKTATTNNDPLFRQALAAALALLAPAGVVYLEAPKLWAAVDLAPLGLECVKSGRAGQVHYHLLQRAGSQGG